MGGSDVGIVAAGTPDRDVVVYSAPVVRSGRSLATTKSTWRSASTSYSLATPRRPFSDCRFGGPCHIGSVVGTQSTDVWKAFLTEFTGRNLWVVTFQDGSGSGFPLPETVTGNELSRRLTRVDAPGDWRATWYTSNNLVVSGLNDAQVDSMMKTVALDAVAQSPQSFSLKAVRRIVNFWRTPVTDLPLPSLEDDYAAVDRWGCPLPPIDWWIENRLSRSVYFNTAVLLTIVASVIGLIIHRTTRPYAIWLGCVLAYFSVVTGVFEIPAYRYRMVTEPVAAIVVGAMIAVLHSKQCQRATSPS